MYWLNKISKVIASVFLNFLYNMVTSIFKTAYVAYAIFVLDSTALDTIHSLWEILFLPYFIQYSSSQFEWHLYLFTQVYGELTQERCKIEFVCNLAVLAAAAVVLFIFFSNQVKNF